MKFYTPPENQGQIIEVSYAGAGSEGLVMQVVDRSDGSEYYRITPWTQKLAKWWDSIGPWNEEPPTKKWGKKLTKAQLRRIVDE
jgi:hypothetical protein